MSTQTFTVTGMTCGHCVASVEEEVSEVAGVRSVDVVLETGALTVTTSDPAGSPDLEAAVRAAVEEAGYQLA